jgi:hypothetical protein
VRFRYFLQVCAYARYSKWISARTSYCGLHPRSPSRWSPGAAVICFPQRPHHSTLLPELRPHGLGHSYTGQGHTYPPTVPLAGLTHTHPSRKQHSHIRPPRLVRLAGDTTHAPQCAAVQASAPPIKPLHKIRKPGMSCVHTADGTWQPPCPRGVRPCVDGLHAYPAAHEAGSGCFSNRREPAALPYSPSTIYCLHARPALTAAGLLVTQRGETAASAYSSLRPNV